MRTREMYDPAARYIGHDDLLSLPLQQQKVAIVAGGRAFVLKAYRQLDPTLLLPTYLAEAKYMPKIVVQLKM